MRSLLTRLLMAATSVAAISGAAHAYDWQNPPPGWRCSRYWYGTNDGCDCGCGRLDPDCHDAKKTSCEYSLGCPNYDPGLVVASQNWRCSGDPLSRGEYSPFDPPPTIPPEWHGAEQQYLDNVCSCAYGSFDFACDSPSAMSCEEVDYEYCGEPQLPNVNWSCGPWGFSPEHYNTGDGCDCGYGQPDPDCGANVSSGACVRTNYSCSEVDPSANWSCGPLDRAAMVPSSSYCSDTVAWGTQHIVFEELILTRINEYRAKGAVCGGYYMEPQPPLLANPILRCAARKHSAGNYCNHTDQQGRSPTMRAQLAGWQGQVSENLACGSIVYDAKAVVDGWLGSPGHCFVMMSIGRYAGVGRTSGMVTLVISGEPTP